MKTEKLNGYFHEKVLQDVGEVSVDSGTLLICDPCYLRSHGLTEEALEEISRPPLQPASRVAIAKAVVTRVKGVQLGNKQFIK